MDARTPIEIELALPFPISTNRIWRRSGSRIIKSAEYREWLEAADGFTMAHGYPKQKIIGHFTAAIVLDLRERGRKDSDNFAKCLLDWLQSREIIKDDSLCDQMTVGWGDAPHGARIVLRSVAP